jgi:hypothetical protein
MWCPLHLLVSNDGHGRRIAQKGGRVLSVLDSLLDLVDFLDTPLRELFRRPRQMAIVLAIGIVLEATA